MISPDDITTLVLRRTFAAPRQRVFRAWIDPKAVEQWLRPRGQRVTIRTLDVWVGGTFRFDIADGEFIAGTYLEIVPPERLVFTWSGQIGHGKESVVRLDFLDQGALTEVVLTHEGLIPETRARAGHGWPSLLDQLAVVVVSSSGI